MVGIKSLLKVKVCNQNYKLKLPAYQVVFWRLERGICSFCLGNTA